MCVLMNNTTGNDQALVRVNVRSGTKCSRYEVVFQLACWSSPYRVENRSMFLPVRFWQVGGDDYSWRSLPPNSSASFFLEDIGRRRLLEVLVDGSDPTTSMTYDIDVVMDHQPLATSSRVKKALRVTVLKEGWESVAPANSLAWKYVDEKYKDEFAFDPRNVRLGLASDGFNPFGMLNVTYTTWLVILIPYNLPPWLCLKQSFWMMSMLVPGPNLQE